ncbi:unnamed protein product [Amoebophrya sp. A120]|nr:unnamed protein product [Amoebophrya sp. A120]|eukprot:GSA120T00010251001.1
MGTVSGAPKIQAVKDIMEMERYRPRGVFAGGLGFFNYDGLTTETCIAIRTAIVTKAPDHDESRSSVPLNQVQLQAGAGIVFDSDPTSEYEETGFKMNVLKSAIKQAEQGLMSASTGNNKNKNLLSLPGSALLQLAGAAEMKKMSSSSSTSQKILQMSEGREIDYGARSSYGTARLETMVEERLQEMRKEEEGKKQSHTTAKIMTERRAHQLVGENKSKNTSSTSTAQKPNRTASSLVSHLPLTRPLENRKQNHKILLVDNYDSFTYNIYQYFSEIISHIANQCDAEKAEEIGKVSSSNSENYYKASIQVTRNDDPDLMKLIKYWDEQFESNSFLENLENFDNSASTFRTGRGPADSFSYISHIVLGPGPKSPKEVKDVLYPVIDFAVKWKIPLLGICLGHQTLCEYFGCATEVCKEEIYHGKPSKMVFSEVVSKSNYSNPLFPRSYSIPGTGSSTAAQDDMMSQKHDPNNWNNDDVKVMRYHSIVANKEQLRKNKHLRCTAVSDSEKQVVLAVEHKHLPIYGVQFHPESIGTERGHEMLYNFLLVHGFGKDAELSASASVDVVSSANDSGAVVDAEMVDVELLARTGDLDENSIDAINLKKRRKLDNHPQSRSHAATPSYFRKLESNDFCNFVFTCAGYPNKEQFINSLVGIQNSKKVDAIEVGVPFSDPFADGPVIEECYRVCLQEQRIHSIHAVLDLIEEAQKTRNFSLPVILMGYLNTFFQVSPVSGEFEFRDQWGTRAVQLGIRHVIVVDMTADCLHVGNLNNVFRKAGLSLIPVLSENVEEHVVQELCEMVELQGTVGAEGAGVEQADPVLKRPIIYATTYMGVTGATTSTMPTKSAKNKFEIEDKIVKTRYQNHLKTLQQHGFFLLMGFGITNGSDVNLCRAAYEKIPNAAVIGTQYLRKAIALGESGVATDKEYSEMVKNLYENFDAAKCKSAFTDNKKNMVPVVHPSSHQRSSRNRQLTSANKPPEQTITPLKVCGYTNREEVIASLSDGVDFFGFNFYEKSPRYVYGHDNAFGNDGEQESLNKIADMFSLIQNCNYHSYNPKSVALLVVPEPSGAAVVISGGKKTIFNAVKEEILKQVSKLAVLKLPPDVIQLHCGGTTEMVKCVAEVFQDAAFLQQLAQQGVGTSSRKFLIAFAFDSTETILQATTVESCSKLLLPSNKVITGLLLDCKKGSSLGGNGLTWEAASVVPQFCKKLVSSTTGATGVEARRVVPQKQLFVAGGLCPENLNGLREGLLENSDVREFMAATGCSLAFDVASGAEQCFTQRQSPNAATTAASIDTYSVSLKAYEIAEPIEQHKKHLKSQLRIRALTRICKPQRIPMFYGFFGGAWVSQLIRRACEQLQREFVKVYSQPSFWKEIDFLYQKIAARPTGLYRAENLTKFVRHLVQRSGRDSDKARLNGATIWLKREDLLHTGAHKINNAIFQTILAKRMGKTRIIAETGAGQHGVATAVCCAYLNLPCTIYMGGKDARRQQLNVQRIESMGAKVVPVEIGSKTLRNAVNQTMRDWASNIESTHYVIGSCIGPAPFPYIVREAQACIGREARKQFFDSEKKLPNCVVGCVGGGSNCIGMFDAFVGDEGVELLGVEAGGFLEENNEFLDDNKVVHSASISGPDGTVGILHGSTNLMLQTNGGQSGSSHSVSAGLDYTGVSPIHSFLSVTGRANYMSISDLEALRAYQKLAKTEGILCALETAHAVAGAMKKAASMDSSQHLIINLSGRGDKDQQTISKQTHMLELVDAIDLMEQFISCTSGRTPATGNEFAHLGEEAETREITTDQLYKAAETFLIHSDPQLIAENPLVEAKIFSFFTKFSKTFVEYEEVRTAEETEQYAQKLADLLFVCREILLQEAKKVAKSNYKFDKTKNMNRDFVMGCIVGTGGDLLNPHNISTPACILAAAAFDRKDSLGIKMLKYGNVASTAAGSGAADLLESLGAHLTAIDSFENVDKVLHETENFSFVFARQFFPILKKFGPLRAKYSKLRAAKTARRKSPTLFNYLGPIVNPCELEVSVLGAHSSLVARAYALVFSKGAQHSSTTLPKKLIVIHTTDGVDKATPVAGVKQTVQVVFPREDEGEKRLPQPMTLTCEDFGVKGSTAEEVYSLTGLIQPRAGGTTAAGTTAVDQNAVNEKRENAINMLTLFRREAKLLEKKKKHFENLRNFTAMNAALVLFLDRAPHVLQAFSPAQSRAWLKACTEKCLSLLQPRPATEPEDQDGNPLFLLHKFIWATNFVGTHSAKHKDAGLVDRICKYTLIRDEVEQRAFGVVNQIENKISDASVNISMQKTKDPSLTAPSGTKENLSSRQQEVNVASIFSRIDSRKKPDSSFFVIPEVKLQTPSVKIGHYDRQDGCTTVSRFLRRYCEGLPNNSFDFFPAVSILTEPCFFNGAEKYSQEAQQTLGDLAARTKQKEATTSPQSRPPVLMKDFFLTERSLARARENNADAVLLIVSLAVAADGVTAENGFFEKPLAEMIKLAVEKYKVEPILEVNNVAEMQLALEACEKAKQKKIVIGVNNRNLKTFQIDLKTTSKVGSFLGQTKQAGKYGQVDVKLVSFSGIKAHSEMVQTKADCGLIDCFLVGTSLMQQDGGTVGDLVYRLCTGKEPGQ